MSDYRGEARQQLKRAQMELASADDQRIKYAALELREAMESLTYDRAVAYKDDFPPNEYETWQPKKVMAQLLEIDSAADKSGAIAFGEEPALGQPPLTIHSLGAETVLNMKALKEHYDALGSFLHVQSLKQRSMGKKLDYAAMRERCEIITTLIEEALASPVFNAIFGEITLIECLECKTIIRRRWPKGRTALKAKCFTPKCGAEYIIEDLGNGKCNWRPDYVDFNCANSACGKPYGLWRSEIEVGTAWDCPECDGRNELRLGVVHISKQSSGTPAS